MERLEYVKMAWWLLGVIVSTVDTTPDVQRTVYVELNTGLCDLGHGVQDGTEDVPILLTVSCGIIGVSLNCVGIR